MTDAEISRRLALAIGWPFAERSIAHPWALVCCDGMTGFRQFDYRDPAVIWVVAERYKCFPDHCADARGDWYAWCSRICNFVYADTAAKAAALAVIKHHEGVSHERQYQTAADA